MCPKCSKGHMKGMINSSVHHRFSDDKDFEYIQGQWNSMAEEQRAMVANHIYFMIPVFDRKRIGPSTALSKRGIANNFNVFYLNVIFQTICGSTVYRLIHSLSSENQRILKALQDVSRDLRSQYGESIKVQ